MRYYNPALGDDAVAATQSLTPTAAAAQPASPGASSTPSTGEAGFQLLAGFALLSIIAPRTVKLAAYGALGVYGIHLYNLYKSKGQAAVIAEVQAGVSSAKSSLTSLQSEELSMAQAELPALAANTGVSIPGVAPATSPAGTG